jgi:hypothetical protein
MASLLEAAARNSSRLFVLDNLYMFGRMGGKPMNEDTPVAPCSRKGEIRTRVAAMWQEAHRAGRVLVVSGRASDYYGPGGVQTYFGEMFWRRVVAGASGQVVTPLDVPHITSDGRCRRPRNAGHRRGRRLRAVVDAAGLAGAHRA